MFKPFAISLSYLPILSSIRFDGGLLYSFMELETLQIHIGCLNKPVTPGIACEFKSAPIIHTLTSSTLGEREGTWHNILLNNVGCTEEQYWESQVQNLSDFLCHLRVNIHYLIDESVIKFARFLVKHGRGLILYFDEHNVDNNWEDNVCLLEGFSRSSTDVKISVASSHTRIKRVEIVKDLQLKKSVCSPLVTCSLCGTTKGQRTYDISIEKDRRKL
ncbi:hypothetical protein DVH24_031446 [Malus domestica]|uniref:FBD domain-containing protein n=1 Tax=Malus domestica TaxID=3750 RepID=A0A498HJH4_MALDO|nr:hypothetical protein DVH24_031446 [Malus domestica]